MPIGRVPSPSSTPHEAVLEVLRRRPLWRSVAYGVGMNLIGFAASRIMNPRGDREWSMPYVLAVHSLATPFMVALSYGFTRLREEDINWWNQVIREQGLRHLGRGVALGCVVYLAQVGVAATLGWVRFQTAGWEGS